MSLLEIMKATGKPYLPLEEEKKLIRRSQSNHQRSTDELCATMYWSIIEIASKLAGPNTSAEMFDEMLSSGVEATLQAINNYDLDSNAHLRTYASQRIRGAMMREMSKHFSILSVPHNAVTEAIKISRYGSTAKELGITEAKEISLRHSALPVGSLQDLDPEAIEDALLDRSVWEDLLSILDPEEFWALCLSYGLVGCPRLKRDELVELTGLTRREIGDLLESSTAKLQEALRPSSRPSPSP